MAFCSNCGSQLEEGVAHTCSFQEPPPLHTKNTGLDQGTILRLIKNPFSMEDMNQGDLIYGVLGMVASVLGFFIWGITYISQIQKTIENALGGLGTDFMSAAIGSSISGLINRSISNSGIDFRLFIFGILSLGILCGSVLVFGNMSGTQKADIRLGLTKLGSTQWVFGVGFLVAAIFAFVSLKLSILFLLIVALIDLCVVVMAGIQLFAVTLHKYMFYIAGSVITYMVVLGLISQSLMS